MLRGDAHEHFRRPGEIVLAEAERRQRIVGMGIESGVDMAKLLAAGAYISEALDRRPESKLGRVPHDSRRQAGTLEISE